MWRIPLFVVRGVDRTVLVVVATKDLFGGFRHSIHSNVYFFHSFGQGSTRRRIQNNESGVSRLPSRSRTLDRTVHEMTCDFGGILGFLCATHNEGLRGNAWWIVFWIHNAGRHFRFYFLVRSNKNSTKNGVLARVNIDTHTHVAPNEKRSGPFHSISLTHSSVAWSGAELKETNHHHHHHEEDNDMQPGTTGGGLVRDGHNGRREGSTTIPVSRH